jgi:hypothetical protein
MENKQYSKIKVLCMADASWQIKYQRYDVKKEFLCGIQ